MPTGIGPNEYILDEAGKDLKSTSKKTLADYLSARTKGGAETFTPPVQGGGDYTYMPPRSNAYPIEQSELTEIPADASRVSPGQFAPDLTAQGGDPNLRNVVKVEPSAERAANGGERGNTVLNSTPLVKPAVSAVLSRNRFSSGDNKFTAKSYSDAMPKAPTITDQRGNLTAGNFKDVYQLSLASARAAMLNAAGGTSGPGENGTVGTSDNLKAGDVINVLNTSQLGLARVESDKLRVGASKQRISSPSGDLTFEELDTVSAVAADFTTAFETTDIDGAEPEAKYTKLSFGQLNTYLEQFSGAGTLNMILLAIVAYVALFIATAVVSIIISLIIGKLPRPSPESASLPLGAERGPRFGAFLFDSGSDSGFLDVLANLGNIISKILGVMQPYEGPIIISYFLAALEGALSIVGIDVDQIASNPVTILTDALPSLLINFGLTPGYYLVLIRAIARDLALLVSGDSGGSGILGVLETIRTLKIVRFVDVCARVGIINAQAKMSDRSMDPDTPTGGLASIQGGDTSSPIGLINNVYETAQKRVSRSRETTGSKRLAWAHSSIGYTRTEIVTKELLRSLSRQSIGEKQTGVAALRLLKARKIASDTGRIDPEIRKYHEALLDAEYMPFYFHDLRTNEILSFHAFLSSLSDSYSSNYTSVDGFGRMDPIQIYKNTTRSVSFTFTAVATSPDDHDQMWYSINKLVNMIYPQWSEGDTIDNGVDTTYTQPFSQTISSSPLLRVRIGDVIHSNYSRFALGRLFGLDKTGAKLPGGLFSSPVELDDNNLTSSSPDGDVDGIYAATLAGQDTTTKVTLPELNLTVGFLNKNAAATAKVSEEASADLNSVLSIATANDLASVIVGNIIRIFAPAPVELASGKYSLYTSAGEAFARSNPLKEKLKDKVTGNAVAYTTTEKTKDGQAYVIVEFDSPIKFRIKDTDVSYTHALAPNSQVTPLASVTVPPLFPFTLPTSTQNDVQTAINEFMTPDTNPIVKSFEDGAGGRGLAGVVTQLGLEYGGTDVTWNVERGSRAPNMVTISVSFTPIHDIPMGLSSDGTARAVAYPIGATTRYRHTPELAKADISARAAVAISPTNNIKSSK